MSNNTELQIVKKQSYRVELVEYEDGTATIQRENRGFNYWELIGLLAETLRNLRHRADNDIKPEKTTTELVVEEKTSIWHPYPEEEPFHTYNAFQVTIKIKPKKKLPTFIVKEAWYNKDKQMWEDRNETPVNWDVIAWAEFQEPYKPQL